MDQTHESVGGVGQLARVLQARDGRADPEGAIVLEHREALLYMLCQGSELEHAIMCQYLFAAFSLKQRAEEGLSETELAAVTRWRKQISHVATQEMLHLTLVNNVLSAIGGAPHLGRPNLPQPANHYPAGVQLLLLPFGEEALRHFMFLERPEGMDLEDADGLVAVGRATPVLDADDIVPRLQDFATVGHLYRSIESGIEQLAAKLGEKALFVGPPRAQATPDNFVWPELVAVTDVASAQRALEEILEQGEGPRGHWRDAHFGQFVAILDEFQELKAANPDFDPVRPVLTATVRPCEHASDVPLITDPFSARCTDLFNVGYEILLLTLERFFAHTEETDEQLAALVDVVMALMFRVIKPLGDVLTTMPAGPDHPGKTVGPSFELFYESDYLMPHRVAAWLLIAERLREAARFGDQLVADAEADMVTVLDGVCAALDSMADTLAGHLPDPALVPPSGDEIVRSGTAWDALLDRAADTAAKVDGDAVPQPGGTVPEWAGDVQRLFGSGWQLLTVLADTPTRERLRAEGAATQLVDSVLRPLAVLLTTAGVGSGRGTPLDARARTLPADVQVWELARAATLLRVAQPGLPELVEATAALHELGMRMAPPDRAEHAQRCLEEMRVLMASLPAGIQSAPDGPYLVTNAETLVDRLGEPLPARPQMALCRCGASARKPWCDGAHATAGWSGAKSPKRVPDLREPAVGPEVTVLDNRGLCAHSGFCTDRLASVFHAGGGAFVTADAAPGSDIVRAVRDCPSGALGYALADREQRADVDRAGAPRPPRIEVSLDGPYRVTGGLPLADGTGHDEARNDGASREHYSLCRCGQSQNKPFCSGMHWYVDFHDPEFPPAHREPTLFEWAGGMPALAALTELFHERYVPLSLELTKLYLAAPADLPGRSAATIAAALGGPDVAEPAALLEERSGRPVPEETRVRWVEAMVAAADTVKLPTDPEFRASLAGYLEFASRTAVSVADQLAAGGKPGVSTPRWTWTALPPAPVVAEADVEEEPVLPAPGEAVGFAAHIRGLFRRKDRDSMTFVFDLWSYADVTTHAADVLTRVTDGSMPCDSTWSAEKVDVFRRWVEAGTPE